MKTIKTKSVLRCPHCGYEEVQTMPENACVHFHECRSCKKIIKPKAGDCCVFCSYGSEKCPPQQIIILSEENES
ncbi:MAG: hypothetical protein M1495_21315 [Bacteroidetes bacterium]|nr:hypothetical protein [Bacteroidota bacterium]